MFWVAFLIKPRSNSLQTKALNIFCKGGNIQIRAPDSSTSILLCSESSLYFHFLSVGGTVGGKDGEMLALLSREMWVPQPWRCPRRGRMGPGQPELAGGGAGRSLEQGLELGLL